MPKVILGTTLSLDGFMADPTGGQSALNINPEAFFKSDFLQNQIRSTGSVVMGRRSYDLAHGDLTGYSFQVPIFVVTHHPPAHGPKGENDHLKVFFVTEGVESAMSQAKIAAGTGDVLVIGGADVPRQLIEKGLVDELSIGIAPVVMGDGLRFFEGNAWKGMRLELIRSQDAARAIYITYRIIK